MFMNRSRLPWMPRPALAAKSESPITTTRVSGFGASASPGLGGAAGVADAVTAAPIAIGPFLSPFDSSSDTWPVVSRLLMSVSAQLRGARLDERLRRVPVDAARNRRGFARQRKRGQEGEALP